MSLWLLSERTVLRDERSQILGITSGLPGTWSEAKCAAVAIFVFLFQLDNGKEKG